jgi:Suppressor of fused protein (SUFU)
MTLEEYRRKYPDSEGAPGWEAIDSRLRLFYPTQTPQHFAAVPHYAIGGRDPIDGISLYQSDAGGIRHRHFVTYGFSELYFNEDALGKEFSKFGFELTFRLKPFPGDPEVPHWVMNFLQNIARYVFKTGKWFEPYHLMTANGPIRADTDTALRAILFVLDPELGVIDTPHGEVQFLQIFGITDAEWTETEAQLDKAKALAERHWRTNPLMITDLERRDG